MKELSPLEEKIHNAGERLIPGITNNIAEFIRHRSSYLFFRQVIEHDIATRESSKPIRIVDLGCGVGHGCETLSELPNSHIVGIDSSPESIEYAETHYARDNITYQVADLVEYIPAMPEFDYVVSRGSLEHVPDGLRLAFSTKWRSRLLFDVPYDEPAGRNPHHVLHRLREEDFAGIPEAELFFQDLDGAIYNRQNKPPQPNMIICVCSHPDLPKVTATSMRFPLPAWQPKRYIGFEPETETLERIVADRIQKVDTVLDIGCGLRPQTFFRPKLHILCEPHAEYVQLLQKYLARFPNAVIFQNTALELTKTMPDKSVDSVFLLDVIEHLEKDCGRRLLQECERIARAQIILYTPLGFMQQNYEASDKDGWGLQGGEWQTHRSGWTPDDFDTSWDILGSRIYHTFNGKGEPLDPPLGAFWAIKTIKQSAALATKPAVLSQFLPPALEEESKALYALFQDLGVDDYCLLSGEDYKDHSPYKGLHSLAAQQPSLPKLPARYHQLPQAFQLPKVGANYRTLNVTRRLIDLILQVVHRAIEARRVLRAEQCDVILACSGNIIDLPAGYLASQLARVPFFAYLFTDYSAQPHSRLLRFFTKRVEPIFCKGASAVIVANGSLLDEYRRRHQIEPVVIETAPQDEGLPGRLGAFDLNDGKTALVSDLSSAQVKFLALLNTVKHA